MYTTMMRSGTSELVGDRSEMLRKYSQSNINWLIISSLCSTAIPDNCASAFISSISAEKHIETGTVLLRFKNVFFFVTNLLLKHVFDSGQKHRQFTSSENVKNTKLKTVFIRLKLVFLFTGLFQIAYPVCMARERAFPKCDLILQFSSHA